MATALLCAAPSIPCKIKRSSIPFQFLRKNVKKETIIPNPDYRIPVVFLGGENWRSGPNAFVGGKNCWKYSTFVNWELWWPNFLIILYFKENQTRPEGQVHFIPLLFNGKQLYDVMVERCGSPKTSAPK